ncbi:MAG: hypothetical protein RRX93_05755 [Bacteroidales bacterium]
MEKNKKRIGYGLIILGSLLFIGCLGWYFWIHQKIYNPSLETLPISSLEELRQITGTIPQATGSSELQEFYSKHSPKATTKESKSDTSLWETNFIAEVFPQDSSLNLAQEKKTSEKSFFINATNPSTTYASSSKPLHVEFWDSPVHYKGYQLNGNNLILFGMDPNDSLRFENHPNGIWMYHQNALFLLKPNSKFAPLESLTAEMKK